tara:strand:+ start:259 stop:1881 length:1623 start_codon:yes stop_codon:yes gene_type:complete
MVRPNKKAYALSDQDKRKLQDLLNKLDPPAPTDDTRETIWLRVKTGTTIEPMSGPDGNLVPGNGIGVQWRQSQRVLPSSSGEKEPVLTKNDRDANGIASEGQDYASADGDLEYKVYNYTPFELFDCSWFCAELSKRGQWVINSPPMPLYFAKSSGQVPSGGVADAELGALDYDVVAAGDNPVPSYFSGITRPVYNPGAVIEANTPFLVSQEPGGKFVVLGGTAGPSQPTYQFKTTTAIGAGDPASGAVGDGSANLWTFNGTSFGIDSSALYDIINPWATTVSQDKMITAYQCHTDVSKYVLVQSECEEESGGGDGGGETDPVGYCIDDSTGLITSNVLQSECTGTWSADEPVSGCCEIGGVNNENVAQSWCTDQSGTFTTGACVENIYDPCPENAKMVIQSMNFADPGASGCASTPWEFTHSAQMGLGYQTGCDKDWKSSGTVASSENPAGGTAVCDGTATYNAASNTWSISGKVEYFNTNTSGTTTVPFTGTAAHVGTDCASTSITANITGGGGNYDQTCDFTTADEISGTISLQMVCN